MTTARQDVLKEDGETPADPFDFGAGHVDPNKAVDPGLTYDADLLDYLVASCGTVTPLLSPVDCDSVQNVLGLSTDPADLNLASIGVGELFASKTITRTVTAVAGYEAEDDDSDSDDDSDKSSNNRRSTYRVSVDAPEGYEVSVSPTRLRLRPGETASYDVTITNQSAPPGEWRFGSLTWRSGDRMVRSPIAVNAVAFIVPPEVFGAGPDGTLDFDVTFGYSGDYTAGVHGLNDADLWVATVEDDPLNSYEFLGPGTDFAFVGEVSPGTAIARWSLFDEYTTGTNDDIDLYLYYCPEFLCSLVDSSGNSGSNEEVSAVFPENDPAIFDPYIVFAHGYQTDGELPSDLLLFAWEVGLVDDKGNMMVTAPPSATIGATETITVNWTGLSLFNKQLGAISHSDSEGVQELTIVNIENDTGITICDYGFICR